MRYYAKLLLLGEHTIIKGSDALAIPFLRFSGLWQFAAPDDPELPRRQHSLPAFAAHLDRLREAGELLAPIDTAAFRNDLPEGLYFRSNIPTGYGLGSSGALCAAVYDRYARKKIEREDTARYPVLKKQLAQLESFFHGASSGTDPLICYLDKAVRLHAENRIEPVRLPALPMGDANRLFLVDTGLERKTGPLVQHFLTQMENEAFAGLVAGRLIPDTNRAIDAFLARQWETLFSCWENISAFQWNHFQQMIPESMKTLWKTGLQSGHFALKLCGAGGGGFLLGYAASLARACSMLDENKLILLQEGD